MFFCLSFFFHGLLSFCSAIILWVNRSTLANHVASNKACASEFRTRVLASMRYPSFRGPPTSREASLNKRRERFWWSHPLLDIRGKFLECYGRVTCQIRKKEMKKKKMNDLQCSYDWMHFNTSAGESIAWSAEDKVWVPGNMVNFSVFIIKCLFYFFFYLLPYCHLSRLMMGHMTHWAVGVLEYSRRGAPNHPA